MYNDEKKSINLNY